MMNRINFLKPKLLLLSVLFVMGVCYSCSDDEKSVWTAEVGVYSNYANDNLTDNLTVTYNGVAQTDKEVLVEIGDYSDQSTYLPYDVTLVNVASVSNLTFRNMTIKPAEDFEGFIGDTIIDNKYISFRAAVKLSGGMITAGTGNIQAQATMALVVTETAAD